MTLRSIGLPATAGVLISIAIALCVRPCSDRGVSNEITFPGGEGRLRVVRTERWIFGPGDGPLEARWILQERSPGGQRRDTQIARNDGSEEELRRVRYELSWRNEGRVLDCRSRQSADVSVLFLGRERARLLNWRPLPPPCPTQPLSADVRRRIEALGILLPARELRIEGEYYGGSSRDFTVDDPEVVLVLGPRFGTHGSTVARGPVILVGEAHLMGPVVSESWILLADRCFPRDQVVAPTIYLRGSPNLNHAKLGSESR